MSLISSTFAVYLAPGFIVLQLIQPKPGTPPTKYTPRLIRFLLLMVVLIQFRLHGHQEPVDRQGRELDQGRLCRRLSGVVRSLFGHAWWPASF